ncbi:type I-B CRISPR-associated protein Cas7/Cst2/DevR [bacterium]|nr:type I-B CRISPR-associated protein Cas7/Cst2/DevR [bacterium]
MAFISGILLIDAPASALNNLGAVAGAMTDNASGVKFIRTKEGSYPYVSGQAFRYWLRNTLDQGNSEWKSAPVYREEKIAYTDANPLEWWDDDLFGYMRAPSKKESAVKRREADESRKDETPTTETITRVSPFRVSTLVSVAPVNLINDFGVMARQDGDPVPHEHQFYRTTLMALLSLNLSECGKFSYKDKTGFLNLDKVRVEKAQKMELQHLEDDKCYRLNEKERLKRISALLQGLAGLDGGAKQAIHYTDVSPDLVVCAVVRGGNSIFGHVIGAKDGKLEIKKEAFKQALAVYEKDIYSKVYVGWVEGYLDEEKAKFSQSLQSDEELKKWSGRIVIDHPRNALGRLTQELSENLDWLN